MILASHVYFFSHFIVSQSLFSVAQTQRVSSVWILSFRDKERRTVICMHRKISWWRDFLNWAVPCASSFWLPKECKRDSNWSLWMAKEQVRRKELCAHTVSWQWGRGSSDHSYPGSFLWVERRRKCVNKYDGTALLCLENTCRLTIDNFQFRRSQPALHKCASHSLPFPQGGEIGSVSIPGVFSLFSNSIVSTSQRHFTFFSFPFFLPNKSSQRHELLSVIKFYLSPQPH